MKKVWRIAAEAVPVLLMLSLIYVVSNDYLLAGLYVVIITISLLARYKLLDITALFLGMVIMTIGEVIFVSSGVEVFQSRSLFGVMPIWLPILWGYGFVAIKRAVKILGYGP